MNNKSKSMIWKKSWSGPRAILFWSSIVAAAGFLFAAVATAYMYFYSPWNLYAWGDGLDYHIRLNLELLAAIVGLAMMGCFIIAVAVVFSLYRLMRRLFARRVPDASAPVGDLSEITQ